jgi:hypothetical protein
MRLTLAQAKASRIPQVLGYVPSDPAFVSMLNEATQRLLSRGKWVGTYGTYQIQTSSGTMTWPRQLETIESIAICNTPVTIRNQWYEFAESGPGLQGDLATDACGTCVGGQLLDRGNFCTFTDITGLVSKVRIYTDVAEAGGAQVLLLGYDQNNNWIRTQVGGIWQDGEYVLLNGGAGGHVDSTHLFSKLVAVQKPVTNGFIRLYAYDTVALVQTAIAVYEPTDTQCSFRRSFINDISNMNGCGCNLVNPQTNLPVQVTVIGKFAFIPVAVDTDYLIIGNIPALKEMCRAVRYGEMDTQDAAQLAQVCESKALTEVQNELNSWLGDGAKQTLRVQNFPGGYDAPVNLI